MTKPPAPTTTAAFQLQAVLSFGVSTGSVLDRHRLPAGDRWIRAFLALGLLYVVTPRSPSPRRVRDAQEASAVCSRVDEARLDSFLAEHDPFRAPGT